MMKLSYRLYGEKGTGMKEYAIHFKSNDGSEEHILGHYPTHEKAEERMMVHKECGNRDVYIMVRDVTEWVKEGQEPKESGDWETRGIFGYAERWWNEHGYTSRLKKVVRSKRIYTINKDGHELDYEIAPDVVNFKKFMDLFQKLWDLEMECKANGLI